MTYYLVRRVSLLVPVLIAVTAVTFFLSHVVPGDPARLIAGLNATTEQVDTLRHELGLDKPVTTQYAIYMRDLLTGDLGTALSNFQPVSSNLVTFFPATFELAIVSLIFSVLIGVPAGVISAVHRGTWLDHASRIASVLGVALPVFVLGIVFVLVFYFKLGIFPSGGRLSDGVVTAHPLDQRTNLVLVDSLISWNLPVFRDAVWHLVLPALVLSLATTARIVRTTRASMLEVLSEPFIATARAKGVPEWRVVWVHGLRNALIPIVTILGISFGYLLGGALLVEEIFDWPGLGRYAFEAIQFLDYPSIQGITLVATICFVCANLLVDVLYVALDPRIRVR